MTRKIKIILLIFSLSLTMSLMSNTYSRYVVDTTGNVKMEFAKWQILVSNTDITNGTASSIELTPVIDENSHVAKGTIAPTSSGHFDIDINPENVDVSFDYEITLSVLNDNMPDLMITEYSILPSDYIEGKTIDIRKEIIEKACEWLMHQEEMIGISFEGDFIERFKKAMEEVE